MRVHGGRLEIEAHAQRAALLGGGLCQGGLDGGAGGEAGGGQRGEAQKITPGYVSRVHVTCDARHAVSSSIQCRVARPTVAETVAAEPSSSRGSSSKRPRGIGLGDKPLGTDASRPR